MIIGKKSLLVFLILVLIVLGLELAVKYLSDFGVIRTRITAELAERLQADVEIGRVGLDVLPLPHLELHGVRIDFVDGSQLRVPLIELSLSLRGLFSGSPEIVNISLEKPDARIVMRRQAPESVIQNQKTRRKEQAAYINSLLQAVPSGITIHGGSVHLTAPDGTALILENVAAETVATLRGVRVFAKCTSPLWEKLALTLRYHDPGVDLSLDARDIDIVKTNAMLNTFAGEAVPAADIRQNLRGLLSTLSLKITIPRVSDPLENAVISGRGSFEDVSLSLQDMEIRELDGDCELNDGTIAASGISARLGQSRIQEAALQLDGTRDFKPSLVTAAFNLDLADVPGMLHLIPDPDVREEIALIKNPRGTATGTFELRAEGEDYSTEIAVKRLEMQSSYRSFPPMFELRQGTCFYRDDVLSFDNFSGKLGSSTLPDFSLSFSIQDGPDEFTAAAKGATVDFVDLRMVLESFDDSRLLLENITHAEGSMKIESLTLKGPLAEPERWTIAMDARLDDVSVTAAALEGPLLIKSAKLTANEHACTVSQARVTYRDANLAGSCILKGYLDGIHTVTADVSGTVGQKTLANVQAAIDMPAVLALRPPVRIESSRFAWSRGGATTVDGDFMLEGSSRVGLNLRAENDILDIRQLTIRDAASQCKLGIKIEEDLFSVSYEGMLKKETLDRVLLKNDFLQGWIQGDFNATFNQKKPRASSAMGKLRWDNGGAPGFAGLPLKISSAVISAQNNMLVFDSAGLSSGQQSAGMQGSIGFDDDGFNLDLTLNAESIDVDAILDRLAGDSESDGSSAEEFWETPLRGTLRLKVQELKKGVFVCNPFEALVSFADRAVTVDTEGTKLCSVALPATARITPEDVTLDVQPRAEKSPMQEVVRCLSGEKDLITGLVDIAGEVRSHAKPDALLDSLEGFFSIRARDGRISKSGLIAKIVSFLSIRNLLSLSIGDMVKSGYPYQSWDIDGDIKGRVLEIQKAILISDSFTLVCRGTIDLEIDKVDLEALATPFQIQNQLLSKVPLIGGWLSTPVLGVPLKISGTLEDVKISTRTTSAVTKGLVDITKGIIKAPIKLISPVFRKKPSEEE
jgi:hypothetical protein